MKNSGFKIAKTIRNDKTQAFIIGDPTFLHKKGKEFMSNVLTSWMKIEELDTYKIEIIISKVEEQLKALVKLFKNFKWRMNKINI